MDGTPCRLGSQAAGIHLGQMLASTTPKDLFPAEAMSMSESMTLYLNPVDKGFPLKEGFELLIMGVDEKPNPKQQFRFQVALNEPGIAEGEPLLETLHQLTILVEGIAVVLTPRLQ